MGGWVYEYCIWMFIKLDFLLGCYMYSSKHYTNNVCLFTSYTHTGLMVVVGGTAM